MAILNVTAPVCSLNLQNNTYYTRHTLLKFRRILLVFPICRKQFLLVTLCWDCKYAFRLMVNYMYGLNWLKWHSFSLNRRFTVFDQLVWLQTCIFNLKNTSNKSCLSTTRKHVISSCYLVVNKALVKLFRFDQYIPTRSKN